MLGETLVCATVSPHILLYMQVQCCQPIQQLHSDFRDLSHDVCHVKIAIAENDHDRTINTQGCELALRRRHTNTTTTKTWVAYSNSHLGIQVNTRYITPPKKHLQTQDSEVVLLSLFFPPGYLQSNETLLYHPETDFQDDSPENVSESSFVPVFFDTLKDEDLRYHCRLSLSWHA